jgi:predicted small lipoprotein YifL
MRATVSGKLSAILGCAVMAALLTACGDHGPKQEPASQTPPATSDQTSTATSTSTAPPATSTGSSTTVSTPTSSTPCPNPPPCGAHCSNYPYEPTDCWTTQYGPAKADVLNGSTNMLYCSGDTYALCFFSGPPTPTGSNPKNNALPCVLHGDTASCTCQAYTSGANFVDINDILNRGAYFETVTACGQDGSKCQNMSTCGPDGKKSGCTSLPQAPVCQYVKNQNPTDPKVSLMPKADLDSTFSFAMSKDYKQAAKPPSCTGLYAGCMTAPCVYKPGHKSPTVDGELVTCECPTYSGTYQVGEENQACTIAGDGKASYVWSAADNVPPSAAPPVGQ